MRRNIIATVKFGSSTISLTLLEKVANSVVELYNKEEVVAEAERFLHDALNEVRGLIGGALHSAGVVIEPSLKVNAQTTLTKEVVALPNGQVQSQDIEAIISQTQTKFASPESVLTLVQPLKFDVTSESGETKTYAKAPLAKSGVQLTLTSAATSISKEVYDFISQIMAKAGLKISQVLLSTQTISQSHLSTNALAVGAVLVHIAEHQSFVTINRNYATLASLCFYDFGFKNLIAGIVKVFNCSAQEARSLVTAHASFADGDDDKVIYTRQSGLAEEVFTLHNLRQVIKAFMTQLLLPIKQFLAQKGVLNLPIVISGKVWKIDNIALLVQNYLQTEHVSVYNPLSFVEMNDANTNTLGFHKFIFSIDEVLSRKFDTIIETNPDTLSSLKLLGSSKKWYVKLLSRLGGTHDWS